MMLLIRLLGLWRCPSVVEFAYPGFFGLLSLSSQSGGVYVPGLTLSLDHIFHVYLVGSRTIFVNNW